MDVNLHQLEIFLCIARERSFSKAAEKLRISQPSVSIQIKNLEESLEVKLFERLGRRVSLTREGRQSWSTRKESRRSSPRCRATSVRSKEFVAADLLQDAAGFQALRLCRSRWRVSRSDIRIPRFGSGPDGVTRSSSGSSKMKWT